MNFIDVCFQGLSNLSIEFRDKNIADIFADIISDIIVDNSNTT